MPFRRLLIALFFMLSAPAFAEPQPAALSEAEKADVVRIEKYLNSITTMRAAFIQATQEGGLYKGMLYIKRPGKMRLQYDPPVENYVVADGTFIYFWDDELKQQSNAPLGSTLADVILRKDLKLSGDVTITGLYQGPGTIELTLIQTKDTSQGTITLVFEDNPLRLRKWRVVDAQNMTTEVALLNPESGIPLDSKLFYYRDPNFGKMRAD